MTETPIGQLSGSDVHKIGEMPAAFRSGWRLPSLIDF
jgi:hypothetical protein